MKQKKFKYSLAFKLNLITVAMVLLITASLMLVFYQVHIRSVDKTYFEIAENTGRNISENIGAENIGLFAAHIFTDEFRRVREDALREGDEEIIRAWLEGTAGYNYYLDTKTEFNGTPLHPEDLSPLYALMFDYELINDLIRYGMDKETIYRVELEVVKDGVAYFLADSWEDLMLIGTDDPEAPAELLEGNDIPVPARMQKGSYGWQCSAYEPVIEDGTKLSSYIAVDLDVNMIMKNRADFLRRSILLVLGLMTVCLLLNLYLIRRIAVKPIRKLTDAAVTFGPKKGRLTKADVIRVDLPSKDEIFDLYQEIQGMQARIVDYTDDLARLTADQERRDTEMRLASGIQSSMLPDRFPAFPDRHEFDLYAASKPAREVGGDFYDFFLIDEDHLALIIADASGKGIPAALFTMSSMIQLKDRALSGGDPAQILEAVNDRICETNRVDMFLTAWLGILNLKTGVLQAANAGHEYPILRGSDGEYALLKDKHGLALGAMEGSGYTCYEIKMEKGQAIFVYTDGVPEANNPDGEFYGTERLISTLNEEPGRSPQETLVAVDRSVRFFAAGAEQFDDLTMLCLTYSGCGKENS